MNNVAKTNFFRIFLLTLQKLFLHGFYKATRMMFSENVKEGKHLF